MFNARLSAGLMHAAQLLGMLRAPESEDIPLQFPPPRGGMSVVPSLEPPVLPPVPSSWLAAPPASSAGARQAEQLAGRLGPAKLVPAIKDKEEEPPTPTEEEEKPPASPAKASRPLKGGQTIAEQIRERVHKARDSLKADRAQACRGMHD
jgi:hypothetical protein